MLLMQASSRSLGRRPGCPWLGFVNWSAPPRDSTVPPPQDIKGGWLDEEEEEGESPLALRLPLVEGALLLGHDASAEGMAVTEEDDADATRGVAAEKGTQCT